MKRPVPIQATALMNILSALWHNKYRIPQATTYLANQGLDKNIKIDPGIVVVSNLAISFDMTEFPLADAAWQSERNGSPEYCRVRWKFIECEFVFAAPRPTIYFSWAIQFMFEKCEFRFSSATSAALPQDITFGFRYMGIFGFSKCDFYNNGLAMSPAAVIPHHRSLQMRAVSFDGNYNIDFLNLYGNISLHYDFRGGNQISRLAFSQDEKQFVVNFSAFERIDRERKYASDHRNQFLKMRQKASERQDLSQTRILDAYIAEFNYYILKDEKIGGIAYWQTVMLQWLRKWTSNFHRSWLRPFLILVVGYGVINLLPVFWVDQFALFDWLQLCFNPLRKTTQNFQTVVGDNYTAIPKIVPGLISFVELVWVGAWGLILRKAIRSL